jgi:hypothetical protein
MQMWMILTAAGIAISLIVAPTRAFIVWVLRTGAVPALAGLKHVLHVIVRAHANVARNFLPRARIFFELNRKRTSHTGE